jgi:hypothetical protein
MPEGFEWRDFPELIDISETGWTTLPEVPG